MTGTLMHGALAHAQPLPWTRLWHNSQAVVVSVALHSAVVAFLVLGWSMEQSMPEPAQSTLKTRLVMLPAEPLAAPPAPEPLPVVAPAPVVEAKPEVVKPKVDPQLQARKLEQAALARKRVEEQKQAQVEQQKAAQVEVQRQRALAEASAQQARVAADNARRAQQAAAAADVRQYLPISKQAPDYPQRALDKGIEGDCTVEYSVTPQGKVDNPKVVGNCHPAFIRPSLVAAATFRYQPRMVDGQAVTVPGVRNTFHYKIQ
ncbi:energy transducer TonB [Pseudomonas sp. CCI3.1]|uniref:energy transducer TonB n=1 Tax=Pseudomonas sp. CCI3.1 TaxID=3048618 RepID=UPI002AB58000|nr:MULTISPECIES: TonB family protein [unclassified Pseudomonas]MDY7584916.1 TonB family protein [Pseudomonas sp. CCI3.1]MEB0066365.1 TonB family protein [Pseudomonas sp. CCI3.1]MEB0071683.1 TonB family protein [Pseudomonas sp. CCI1.4]